MSRIILIGCTALTARLPEALAGHGLELVAVGGSGSPFRHSRFVDRFVPLAAPFSPQAWATELLAHPGIGRQPGDWMIHSNDALPFALARADAPLERRLALLPIRRVEGLAMVGSKVGLAELLQTHAIPTPPTQLVTRPADLEACLRRCSGPLMVKADQGSGGEQLRRWADPEAVLADPPPLGWYPLLLQAWVAATTCSVDALFAAGELLALVPSRSLITERCFGPDLCRRFLPVAPEGVIRSLQALGQEGGLHGLFNTTFLLPADGSGPLLIEADPRPTAWHALGPRLGVDWGALMAPPTSAPGGPRPDPLEPHGLPPQGRVVHLFPRAPAYALRTLSWSVARPWLLARPGTWEFRLRADRAIGDWEWRSLRQAFSLRALAGPLQRLAAELPDPVQRFVRRRGLDRALLRWLGF
jgi:hypothetical protein